MNGRPADHAPDKKRAIAEILNFKDADKLLDESRYAAQFGKGSAPVQ